MSVPCRVVLGCECSAESTREEHGSHALVHSLSLPPHTPAPPGGGATATPSSFCTSTKKEKRRGGGRSYGYESPCTSRHRGHRHAAGPAAPRHPPQRHVEQPAAPGTPGAPPGGATTPSSAAKSTDLTAATRPMRRQQRGKAKTHLGGQCCTGPPRRGIARAHPGDGGHDADARSGRPRADRGLLSGCTLLRSAPEQPRTAKGATSRRRRWRHGTCATMGSAVEAVPEGPLPPGFEPCKRPPSPRPDEASSGMPF